MVASLLFRFLLTFGGESFPLVAFFVFLIIFIVFLCVYEAIAPCQTMAYLWMYKKPMKTRDRMMYFINTTFNYPTMAEAYRVAGLNGYNRLF